MIEKGYVDEYYEKLGDWGGVTGYLRTGPNADALTRVWCVSYLRRLAWPPPWRSRQGA